MSIPNRDNIVGFINYFLVMFVIIFNGILKKKKAVVGDVINTTWDRLGRFDFYGVLPQTLKTYQKSS